MTDRRRQGVPETSSLLEVAGAGTHRPLISGRRLETDSSSQPVNNDKRDKDLGLHEQDNESSDDDDDEDDPLLQELKEELEQRTYSEPNLTKQQKGQQQQQQNSMQETQKEIHQPPSRQAYDTRIAVLMERMDEEQMNRFEAFRRSTLSRANMKKLVSSLINQTSNDEKVNIVLCSLGKMFVCDLIETARRVAEEEGVKVDALTRSHVFQAHRILKKKNKLLKRRAGRFFSNL